MYQEQVMQIARDMAGFTLGEADDANKIICYRDECKKLADYLNVQINLLPPDVNSSHKYFNVDGDNISFGLIAVKHVGPKAIDAIVENREQEGSFTSLQDFCERVDTRVVNKRTIESLIMCGAFDSLEEHRAPLLANLHKIMRVAKTMKAERERGQLNLFNNGGGIPFTNIIRTETPEYQPLIQFKMEKDLLGFYVSGHPLQEYQDIIDHYTTTNARALVELPTEQEVSMAGMITRVKKLITPKGSSMALVAIEDLKGQVMAIVLPDVYKKAGNLVVGKVVWTKGVIKNNANEKNLHFAHKPKKDQPLIQAIDIIDIEAVPTQLTSSVGGECLMKINF